MAASIDDVIDKFSLNDVFALPQDASARRYYRAIRNGKNVIIMLYPDADDGNKAELIRFLDYGSRLDAHAIRVAQCYEADIENGYALLEDLGEKSFGALLRSGKKNHNDLYDMATRTLLKMTAIKDLNNLPEYKKTQIYKNRRQFVDYYMAYKKGEPADEECAQEFLNLWDEIEAKLPPSPHGFVHGDYHLENMMYLEHEVPDFRSALIDYQDAFYGPVPYDLLNLLEDARADVPQQIRKKMIKLYTAGMSENARNDFMMWYKVLAAQFHCRVIGLFLKLTAQRQSEVYLQHIPRLQHYLATSYQDPLLEPFHKWLEKVGLDFNPIKALDKKSISTFFSRAK
ncbi:MAG: aminoglycoside phosphotransferase family protein [Alphaproteobacteria bacterium]